ncbi:MAG TPA: cytochrome c [Paenibacillaceae bacterium]
MAKKSFTARLAAFLSLAVLAASLAACGGSAGSGAASGGRAARGTLPDGPAETIELYRTHCLVCHGPDLAGNMGPSTDLTRVGANLDRDAIRRRIAEGGDMMPPFADKLSDKDMDALADWLAEQR